MCIRDSNKYRGDLTIFTVAILLFSIGQIMQYRLFTDPEYSASKRACLLYTSDAADERSSVDLGGRRIIKKKKQIQTVGYTTSTNKV